MAAQSSVNHIAGKEDSQAKRTWGEEAGQERACVCLGGWGPLSTALVPLYSFRRGCLSVAVCPGSPSVLTPPEGLGRVRSVATRRLLSFQGR